MLKTEQAKIKKRASIHSIGLLTFANIVLFLVYWNTMHVVQSDFSKLGAEKLRSEVKRIGFEMSKRACLVTDGLSAKAVDAVEKEAGLNSITKCTEDCGVCFTVTENASAVKQKAMITVKDQPNGMMDVQV